jgi:hypothetical protein
MKYIITERQLKLISEQSMTGWGNYVPQGQQKSVVKGWDKALTSHDMNVFLGIVSVLIPVIGPFISSMVGLGDAARHFQEGNKKAATIITLFSLIPLSGKLLGLIPELNQVGVRGSVALAEKLLSKTRLTPVEVQVVKKVATNKNVIQAELKTIEGLLKSVEPSITKYKDRYIQKFGEQKYKQLLSNYISQQINSDQFNQTISKV